MAKVEESDLGFDVVDRVNDICWLLAIVPWSELTLSGSPTEQLVSAFEMGPGNDLL